MLMDRLTTLSLNVDLTGAAAGSTVLSDVLDLSVVRDLGTADVPISIVFSALPAAPAGTTLNVLVQTSADNQGWVNLFGTTPDDIGQFSAQNPWVFRGELPAGVQRYLRVAFLPSAAFTAGKVTAQVGADWPRTLAYPRNYVA